VVASTEDGGDESLLRISKPVSKPVVTVSAPDRAAPGDTVSLSLSIDSCTKSGEPCSMLAEDARVILYVVDQAWLELSSPNSQQPLQLTREGFLGSYSYSISMSSTIEKLLSVESVRSWPQVCLHECHELCRRCACALFSSSRVLTYGIVFSLPLAMCV
jgi:hypothetical protein